MDFTDVIDTEHVLLGLVEYSNILGKCGVTCKKVEKAMRKKEGEIYE
jgi:hypothetical protein